jgi:hypothetical protein
MLQVKEEHDQRDDCEGRIRMSIKPSNDTFLKLWFDDSYSQSR